MQINLRALKRVAVRMLALVGLVAVVVLFTPLVPWWARILAGPWTDATGENLILLGASPAPDNVALGESSYWRSIYAIRAYREEQFRTIVIIGGGRSRPAISEAMASFLQCQGIPAAAIHVEIQSDSTRQNAVNSADMLAHLPGRSVLMTSDYHMWRAWRAFRKLGVELVPRPIPDAIKRGGSFQGRFGAFVDVSRETAAIVYYYSRGWI